jgi:hypothetical protein
MINGVRDRRRNSRASIAEIRRIYIGGLSFESDATVNVSA